MVLFLAKDRQDYREKSSLCKTRRRKLDRVVYFETLLTESLNPLIECSALLMIFVRLLSDLQLVKFFVAESKNTE